MDKVEMPDCLICDRVVLKRHQVELAEQMFKTIDGDRQRLRKFLPWVDTTKLVKDSLEYIQMTQKWWDESSMFDYGIYLTNNSSYIGNIGVHNIAWNHRRCELGYWISTQYEGKGYISEALVQIEKWLFSIGMNRIEIRCSSTNLKSSQVPLRNGYQHEGTLTQEFIENGEYRDTLIYAKLRSMVNQTGSN